MAYSGHTKEEVVRQGRQIYERGLREKVEPEHRGKFLVLDVLTGEYEIAEKDLVASDRLLDRNPDAVLYGLRIGYPTAYRIGAGLPAVGGAR